MRNLVIGSLTLFGLLLTGCGDININQPAKPNVIIEKSTTESPVSTVTSDETEVPAPENADISYFYTSLSPDGSWTNDKEYGWSWSPAIADSDSNWRPYVDNGSWVYTDNGWYWNSGYKWGWAAFHYGRWSHRENRWYWHPDNVWGSSWVSWRNNDTYYGWAPLTPQARWESSGGLNVNLTAGNFDHNIGLNERDYCFVHSNNFLEVDIHKHQIPPTEVVTIYNNTTVINNSPGRALVPIVDAAAVQAVVQTGIGAIIRTKVGGTLDAKRFQPLEMFANQMRQHLGVGG